jgi:hypothetical protein
MKKQYKIAIAATTTLVGAALASELLYRWCMTQNWSESIATPETERSKTIEPENETSEPEDKAFQDLQEPETETHTMSGEPVNSQGERDIEDA